MRSLLYACQHYHKYMSVCGLLTFGEGGEIKQVSHVTEVADSAIQALFI
jgi:hypothetical protein